MKKFTVFMEGVRVYLTKEDYINLLKSWGYTDTDIAEELEKNAVEIIPVEEW